MVNSFCRSATVTKLGINTPFHTKVNIKIRETKLELCQHNFCLSGNPKGRSEGSNNEVIINFCLKVEQLRLDFTDKSRSFPKEIELRTKDLLYNSFLMRGSLIKFV